MPDSFHCPAGHAWTAAEGGPDQCPQCGGGAESLAPASTMPLPPAPPAGLPAVVKRMAERLQGSDASPDVHPVIAGYEILDRLGRGGMGVVYQARQALPDRLVAIKVLRTGLETGDRERRRFRAEAESAARLVHPNIVQIYEVGDRDGRPFFSMEYVAGGNLATRLAGQPQPPRHTAQLVRVLAAAAHFAHQHGIIHRDLKPANILLTADGTPKISDFGLAKRLDAPDGQTQSGELLGTPSYMAPEQATGQVHAIGPATDVYGFGAVLYEMLTGRPPFLGVSAIDMIHQVVHDDPVPLTRLQPAVPRDLETICLKCLRKEPRGRYGSALELAEDLHRYLEGKPIHARPISVLGRFTKWARRRPTAAALMAVIAVTVPTLLLLWAGFTAELAFERNRYLEERDRAIAHEKDAKGQRAEAVKEGKRAEAEARTARRHLYNAHILLAGRHWREGHVDKAIALLNSCRPGPDQEDLRHFEWHYLWRQCHSEALAPPGHSAVAFSLDGRTIAAAGGSYISRGEGTVLVSTPAGIQFTMRGHTLRVVAVAFNPDGKVLASASDDGTVRLWNPADGSVIAVLEGHRDRVLAVAFSPDGKRLASASADRTLRLWDVERRELVQSLEGHSREACGVAFSPDGKFLASASGERIFKEPGEVILWNLATGQSMRTLAGRKAVSFSADSRSLAAVSIDAATEIKVWDVESGRLMQSLRGHTGLINSVAFHPKSTDRLASAGYDRTVILWDSERGRELYAFRGHSIPILQVAFQPGGRYLAASTVGGIKAWNAARDPEARTLRFEAGNPIIAYAPDGKHLFVGAGSAAQLWQTDVWKRTGPWPAHPERITCAAFAPNGAILATGCQDRRVRLWNASTFQLIRTLEGHEAPIAGVVFSPDGKHIVSADGLPGRSTTPGVVHVWDADSGKRLHTWRDHFGPVSSIAYRPDGKVLAVSSGDSSRPGRGGVVHIWDMESAALQTTIQGHEFRVNSVAFSPDGARLATASLDQAIKIWDARTFRLLGTLVGHTDRVQSLAFSADSRRLASGSSNQEIKVWDVAAEQELLTLTTTGSGPAIGVAFHPNGQQLASAHAAASIKIWEARQDFDKQGAEP